MKCRCNGYVIPVPKLNEVTVSVIESKLDEVRKKMVSILGDLSHEKEIFAWHRFNNNHDAIVRIAAAYKDHEITPRTLNKILIDALYDCMRSDYWYRFEKDWGCECTSDCEEE